MFAPLHPSRCPSGVTVTQVSYCHYSVCLIGGRTCPGGHQKISFDINPPPRLITHTCTRTNTHTHACPRRLHAPTHNPSVTSHFPFHEPLRQSNRSCECVLCLLLTLECMLCMSFTHGSWTNRRAALTLMSVSGGELLSDCCL